MTDSWHVLGDYFGACVVVVAVLAALHYRGRAAELAEDLATCERDLKEAHDVLAGPLDDEPKTPRSS